MRALRSRGFPAYIALPVLVSKTGLPSRLLKLRPYRTPVLSLLQSGTLWRTSLTNSSTLPGTLRYGSPALFSANSVAELSADSDVWDLMRWPARKPTLEEIYWIAGVFEGEGSFCTSHIRIVQKDREILDAVRRLVGGRVMPYVSKSAIKGPTPMFVWYATGPRGRGIARALFHILSSRRQAQARIYLRISRFEAPPKLDPAEPTRLLWDWAPAEELD